MRPSIITVLVLLLSASVSAQPAGEIAVDVPIRWMQTGDGADRRTDPGAAASFEHRFNDDQGRLFYDMMMDAFGTDQPFAPGFTMPVRRTIPATPSRAIEPPGRVLESEFAFESGVSHRSLKSFSPAQWPLLALVRDAAA
jgi:hypothetical protein